MADHPDNLRGNYPTTQWTQLIEVIQKGDGDSASSALGEFCVQYRPAVYNFFRNHAKCSHEHAEDYTQNFFSKRILEKWDDRAGFLHKAERRENAKFRSFLANVLWKFLMDEWKKGAGQAAGGGTTHTTLDGLDLPDTQDEASAFSRFGRQLDSELALELIKKSAARFKHSDCLEAHLRGDLSQKEAAAKLGLSENAFRQAYSRFRERLAVSLWEEVAKLVGPDEEDIRAEIRYLMSLFAESKA
jgi:DNA-directed RNA polymerase specialized sigma24 family protein